MTTQYVTNDLIGERIRFQSKNDKDSTVWEGTVAAIVTPTLAQTYSNTVVYHENVRRVDPEIPTLENCHHFVIMLASGGFRAFCNEWILNGSFTHIQERVRITVDVYDLPTNDPNDIITVLQAAGYKAVIT